MRNLSILQFDNHGHTLQFKYCMWGSKSQVDQSKACLHAVMIALPDTLNVDFQNCTAKVDSNKESLLQVWLLYIHQCNRLVGLLQCVHLKCEVEVINGGISVRGLKQIMNIYTTQPHKKREAHFSTLVYCVLLFRKTKLKSRVNAGCHVNEK